MKKILFILMLACSSSMLAHAQSQDPLVSSCVMDIGDGAKYLKDFKVQLGKGSGTGELRYKERMSLWKNTKYRFTMYSDANSQGQLIITIKDENNSVILSSYDEKSDKIYSSIDFICNRSGIYQICYDFYRGEAGLGIGVVSMVRK